MALSDKRIYLPVTQGPLCMRWSLTDAIASAVEESEKVARVDKLKAAIQAGQIDGQAVDATNPERHDMMDAWCADASAVDDSSIKRQVLIIKHRGPA